MTLEQGETREIDVTAWTKNGRGGNLFTSVIVSNADATKNDCVVVSGIYPTLTIVAHSDSSANVCTSEIRVSITDSENDNINDFDIDVTVNAAPTSIVSTGTIDAIALNKSTNHTLSNIEDFFTGAIGTVTYSASSGTTSCVTVGTVGPSGGSQTLVITATAASSICTSRITITATDSANSANSRANFHCLHATT